VKADPSVLSATSVAASNFVRARLNEARSASAWPDRTPGRLNAAPKRVRRLLSSAAPLTDTLPSNEAAPPVRRSISPASDKPVADPDGPVTIPVETMSGPETSPARPASSPPKRALSNV